MNHLVSLATGISLILFPFIIQPWIERRWGEDTKLPINQMIIAVGSALVLSEVIDIIAGGVLPVSTYFIVLASLIGIFLYYGFTHRNEVSQRMRKAYLNGLISFTFVLSATGVLIFIAAPLFPNVIL